jgi:hypothetical protein
MTRCARRSAPSSPRRASSRTTSPASYDPQATRFCLVPFAIGCDHLSGVRPDIGRPSGCRTQNAASCGKGCAMDWPYS